MIGSLLQRFRRRHWRADPAALAAFEGLKPIKVVTGGSEGIGFAIAEEFVRLGDHVLLVARTAETLNTAATSLHSMPRADDLVIATLALDVTAPDACQQIDAALAANGGYCDVLVNCAGVGVAGTFASVDPQRLDAVIAVNVAALTRLTRHVLPGMLTRGRGGVMNVSSLGGFAPAPYQAAYYASKSYVTLLTEALAHECRGQGVRIAVLVPGPARTAFHERMGSGRGLHLKLLTVLSPRQIARLGVLQFRLGQRVIAPGVWTTLLMLALRYLPHRLIMPLVAPLFRPRA